MYRQTRRGPKPPPPVCRYSTLVALNDGRNVAAARLGDDGRVASAALHRAGDVVRAVLEDAGILLQAELRLRGHIGAPGLINQAVMATEDTLLLEGDVE